MADMPVVDLTAAAKVMVHWLDDKPLNPEATGPLIDLWMTLLGFNTDPDTDEYEPHMMEAVALAFDLADPPAKPPTVTVDEVVVQGEVL